MKDLTVEMSSLVLETEALGSEVYRALGLNGSSKEISGSPQVLSLISLLLERSVQKNEKLLDTTKKKEVVTIFHGMRPPTLSIRQYLDRIFKYSSCSPSCFVVAYIYMERFLQRTNVLLISLNVHRLLITSVMLAAKFIDDAFFNNAYYARVGGVSTTEMNRLEIKFLFSLDFRLQVTVDTFRRYCLQLEKEAATPASYQIERSIKVCGLNQGWNNGEESKGAAKIQRFSCGAV